jgi:hypothetical protein
MFKGVSDSFEPAVDLELIEDTLNVVSHCGRADGQGVRYVVGAESLAQERQHLAFTLGQEVGEGTCRGQGDSRGGYL